MSPRHPLYGVRHTGFPANPNDEKGTPLPRSQLRLMRCRCTDFLLVDGVEVDAHLNHDTGTLVVSLWRGMEHALNVAWRVGYWHGFRYRSQYQHEPRQHRDPIRKKALRLIVQSYNEGRYSGEIARADPRHLSPEQPV